MCQKVLLIVIKDSQWHLFTLKIGSLMSHGVPKAGFQKSAWVFIHSFINTVELILQSINVGPLLNSLLQVLKLTLIHVRRIAEVCLTTFLLKCYS